MKAKQFIKSEATNLKNGTSKNFALCLLFCTIILFLYCYFGSFSFFEKTFTNVQDLNYWKIIYHNAMSFVLFFCIGIIFTKLVLKEKLKNFGIAKGNAKLSLILILIALPVTALCGLACVLDKGMSATYPLIDFNVYSAWWQIALYFLSYLLYYIGWEYLFRGLLYFSSESQCGVLGAILITTLISALIHTSIASFGKPLIETLSAIPAGLIFAYLDSKTRNIYTSIAIHFMVGIFTDIFIFLI